LEDLPAKTWKQKSCAVWLRREVAGLGWRGW